MDENFLENLYNLSFHIFKRLVVTKIQALKKDNFTKSEIVLIDKVIDVWSKKYSIIYLSKFSKDKENQLLVKASELLIEKTKDKDFELFKNYFFDFVNELSMYEFVDIFSNEALEAVDNLMKIIPQVNPEKGTILSDWIVVDDDFCATRCYVGTNPEIVENRIAFIEKTPSIRFNLNDSRHNWHQGDKGSGGTDGHIPENEIYGFYPPSRKWADVMLKILGYELTNTNN